MASHIPINNSIQAYEAITLVDASHYIASNPQPYAPAMQQIADRHFGTQPYVGSHAPVMPPNAFSYSQVRQYGDLPLYKRPFTGSYSLLPPFASPPLSNLTAAAATSSEQKQALKSPHSMVKVHEANVKIQELNEQFAHQQKQIEALKAQIQKKKADISSLKEPTLAELKALIALQDEKIEAEKARLKKQKGDLSFLNEPTKAELEELIALQDEKIETVKARIKEKKEGLSLLREPNDTVKKRKGADELSEMDRGVAPISTSEMKEDTHAKKQRMSTARSSTNSPPMQFLPAAAASSSSSVAASRASPSTEIDRYIV